MIRSTRPGAPLRNARQLRRATKRAVKGSSLDGALRPLHWCERRSAGNQEGSGIGWQWARPGSLRYRVPTSAEWRTHNATPVSYRTRALARVRLAPTGVRYACGSDARGVYRTALLFDRSRVRPLIGVADHDQRNRHGRTAHAETKKENQTNQKVIRQVCNAARLADRKHCDPWRFCSAPLERGYGYSIKGCVKGSMQGAVLRSHRKRTNQLHHATEGVKGCYVQL